MKRMTHTKKALILAVLLGVPAPCSAASLKRVHECQAGAEFEKVNEFDTKADQLWTRATELRDRLNVRTSPGSIANANGCRNMRNAQQLDSFKAAASANLAAIQKLEVDLKNLDDSAKPLQAPLKELKFEGCYTAMTAIKQKIMNVAGGPILANYRTNATACGATTAGAAAP